MSEAFLTKAGTQALIDALVRMRGGATDAQALDAPELYPKWRPSVSYAVDDRLQYNGALYRCLQAHTSQADWAPDAAVSLYKRVEFDAGVPVWSQPVGASDAYSKGDKVSHKGKIWVSIVDANVWEPGVYGWQEAAA